MSSHGTAPDGRRRRPYKVIAISIYKDVLAQLDAHVERLKQAGVTTMNRSWFIREAIARIDVAQLIEQLMSPTEPTTASESEPVLDRDDLCKVAKEFVSAHLDLEMIAGNIGGEAACVHPQNDLVIELHHRLEQVALGPAEAERRRQMIRTQRLTRPPGN